MRRKRVRKWLARGSIGLSMALLSLILLVLVGIQLPWVRSWLAGDLSRRISAPIAGTVSILEIGAIGLGSVSGVDAELLDASGRRVATLSGGSAELDLFVLVRSWLGDEPLTLAFERVAASRLEARLIEDANGELSIVTAFDSKEPTHEPDPTPPAEPLRLAFETIDVGEVRLSYPAGSAGADALEVELTRLIASASRRDGRLRADLRHLGIHARHLPIIDELRGDLAAEGAFDIEASTGASPALDLHAQFSGAAAEIPIDVRVSYAGGRLQGFVEVEASPPSLHRLWADAAVPQPVHLFVGFEGNLDELEILSVLESSGGNLYVSGHVRPAPPVSGELSVLAAGVNLGRWLEDTPETRIDLAAAVRFSVRDGGVAGRAALRTWDSRWDGQSLPDLAASAQIVDGTLTGNVRTQVPGARAVVRAKVPIVERAGAGERLARVSLDVAIEDLARASGWFSGGRLSGSGNIEGTVNVELGTPPRRVEATLHATFHQLSAGGLTAERMSLAASARGPVLDPHLEVSVEGRQVAIPGYPLRRVSVRARGGLDEARVSARIEPTKAGAIRLSASILPRDLMARDLAVVMQSDDQTEPTRASAERIALRQSGVDVRRFVLAGPGRVELDALSARNGRIRARGRTVEFSAAELARRLGIDVQIPPGAADVEAEVDYRPGHISGSLRGSITELRIGEAVGRAQVAVEVNDNTVDGELTSCFPAFGDVELRADSLTVPLQLDPERFSQLSGDLEVIGRADLERLRALPVLKDLPLPRAGQLHAHVKVEGQPGAFPEITAALATHDLAWPAANHVNLAEPGAPRATSAEQELDVELVAKVTGSGATLVAALLLPSGESLAEVRGETQLDLARLLRSPRARDVRELPIAFELRVPRRELRHLPIPSALGGLDGFVSADVRATGTLGRPALEATLALTGLKLEGERTGSALAITADAKLEGERLTASAFVRDPERKLLSLDAVARLSGGGAPPALEQMNLDVRSNGLPLESIGALAGLDVEGELYGSLRLDGLGTAPSVDGTLWINGLDLDGVRQEQVRWTIHAGEGAFRTQLTLSRAGGEALLSASGPLRWRDALIPTFSVEQTRVDVVAKNFQLRALRPVLPEAVRGLGGSVNADLTIHPGAEGSHGELQVREGAVYVAALGQEFRGIRLDAQLAPSGVLQITDLRGRALQGRLSARGQARFAGTRFVSAELQAKIPRGDPLPFMLQGVTMANAWGSFEARAELDAEAERQLLRIDVEISRLQVELPRQAPRDVQQLEEDPTVLTGTYRTVEGFVSLPLPPYEPEETEDESAAEPLVTRVEVTLGDRTWIERGTELEVKIAGTLVLEVREELVARGQVRIERGMIDVQGKIFEIENGTVTFVEDRAPSNPTVTATARYTAPEGTDIYAEFVGPAETGKLTLRSEPPLRDDQILSLLLFGTPDGNFGASTGDGTFGGAALAAGGSLVTRGLNQELRRLTSLDVQTRIGEHEGEPRPEVIVQISPRLTAELAYSLAAPTPGREEDRTYVTLDLRLFRNWSLSTTIGDAGSLLLELLWRFRY